MSAHRFPPTEHSGQEAVEAPTLPLPPPREQAQIQRTPQPETGMAAKAEPPSYLAPLTREDVARNAQRLKSLPTNLHGLEAFLPELEKMKPAELLHVLQARFTKDPNPANAALLQYGINRITTCGPVDPHIRDAITKAVEALHKPSAAHPGSTDDLFCWAYVDANFGGASMFLDLSPGWVYWAETYVGSAMNDKISSLTCSCTSDEVGGNFCLFENARFFGRYQNYALTVPPDLGPGGYAEEDVSYVGDSFNDITSSILLVRRFANETRPVSVSGLVPQSDITNIVNAQSSVSSGGDATFTWDLWPNGPTSGSSDTHPDDPEKAFLWVIVPINVDTHTIFGTYSAQIRYWVYIYVDGDGNLQGYVDTYGCWVQGGWITGDVQNGLMEKIPGTIGQVNGLISNALSLANLGGPYRFAYYLPGKNVLQGSTWDDVTIVAVKPN
jgi:hypothetical protein